MRSTTIHTQPKKPPLREAFFLRAAEGARAAVGRAHERHPGRAYSASANPADAVGNARSTFLKRP